jgi:hypothetical protein
MSILSAALPLILVVVSSLILIMHLHWRWTILALAGQYLAVFLLVSHNWPLGLSAVKLVAGWMAGAVLAASHATIESEKLSDSPLPGRIFRVFAGLLVFIVVFSIESQAQDWIPAGEPVVLTGLILIFMGLLQLGMTSTPFRATIGLLTTLSGFEILYAAVVTSVLVTGLLALITLGLAMAGAYLMNVANLEEETV